MCGVVMWRANRGRKQEMFPKVEYIEHIEYIESIENLDALDTLNAWITVITHSLALHGGLEGLLRASTYLAYLAPKIPNKIVETKESKQKIVKWLALPDLL